MTDTDTEILELVILKLQRRHLYFSAGRYRDMPIVEDMPTVSEMDRKIKILEEKILSNADQ